jgi:hypothetical protein
MSNEVAAITQHVYSAADRVAFKAEGVLLRMDTVRPAYEAAKEDPSLAKAVEQRVQYLARRTREASKRAAATKLSRQRKEH